MAFDWLGFLDSYGVPYITKGANVAKNHVSIHCPFCGSEDPSEHMSINFDRGGWKCYRKPLEHYGKNPARLVAAVLGISKDQADTMVGNAVYIPSDFMGAVNRLIGPKLQSEAGTRFLRLRDEFRPLELGRRSARPFVRYLEGRGFKPSEIERMHDRHGLMYAVDGPQRNRIIFPVEFDGALVSWTGRSINPDEQLRYKTLSTDPDTERYPALGPISDFLLWGDDIAAGGECLALCEGPFDALNVRTLGRSLGVYATCCFTAQPSAAQMEALYTVAPRFKRRVLLLDRGTLATSLKIASELAALQIDPRAVPAPFKDPGEFRTSRDLIAALGNRNI